MPIVYQAWRLFEESSLSRWTVEARLLANETTPAIACKCGLLGEVVDVFHDVYFAVRPHLGSRDWILNRVIVGETRVGMREPSTAELLRLYGFLAGPSILDDLLAFFARPPSMPETLDGLDEAALADLQHRLAIKSALLTRSLRVDEAGLRRLLMLRDRCEEERHKDQEMNTLVDRVLPANPFTPAKAEPGVVPFPAATGNDLLHLRWDWAA
jgi:hypothetical protein